VNSPDGTPDGHPRFIPLGERLAGAQVELLRATERSVYSQNGEDGVIAELVRRTDCSHTMIELGAGNGDQCNSRWPRESGWEVLAFDGDPEGSEWVLPAFLTAENIATIVDSHRTTAEPIGVLSIDLDGNDFWMFMAVPDRHLPTVLVMEYNATVGPVEALTVGYRPRRMWDHSNHFGASLAALTMLAQHRGYELVYCESNGVNAFFVSRTALRDADLVPVPVAVAYQPPRFGLVGPVGEQRGHEPSTRRLLNLRSIEEAQQAFDASLRRNPTSWPRYLRHRFTTSDLWRLRHARFENVRRNIRGARPTK
jgi:hypothetical protein